VPNNEWGVTISADHQLFTVSDTAIRAGMLRGTRFNPVNEVALKLLRQFTILAPCVMCF
jgi:hypothetical protein